MAVTDSVLGAIGNTPSVWLDRLTHACGVDGRILAKLDNLNPGGSKKDRAALQTIAEAEAEGRLRPGQTVVELTSGNMGTGLAIVCAVKGYAFVAVMSRGNSPERAMMMRALGAEVVLVDQAPGSPAGQVSGTDLALVEAAARKVTSSRQAFRADQFVNLANRRAHARTTGPELWRESGGSLTAFVDFVGSGGTFAGVMDALEPHGVAGWIAEPEGAAVLAGGPAREPNHPIQGGGYSRKDLALLTGIEPAGFVTVSAQRAISCTRLLARSEGILGGFSAGANLAAALEVLKARGPGACVGFVVCDSGMKYLSTDLWQVDAAV